jgi:hypothetical protein
MENFQIDPEDAATLYPRKVWKQGGYCKVWHLGKNVQLHRWIMKPTADMVVDHINGDTMDNRRCNLRVCTRSQNMMNSRKQRWNVYPHAKTGKWKVLVRANGKLHYGGLFNDRRYAQVMADMMVIDLHGDYAKHSPCEASDQEHEDHL